MRKTVLYFILFIFTLASSCTTSKFKIVSNPGATGLEKLAASELRRYIYLRTGSLLPMEQNNEPSENSFYLRIDSTLKPEAYSLKGDEKSLVISGGSASGLLYGVYAYAEHLGIRFYLDGDVVPDQKSDLELSSINIQQEPAFELRGVLPFHDFPEGPDWWGEQDYKTMITQLAKMKMNFIGFHTYPFRNDFNGEGHKAEPLVWIGKEEDIQPDGSIKTAYPVLHFVTNDSTWGYAPRVTSHFLCGGSQLFETDVFGADYMKNVSSWPHTPSENLAIFNSSAKMIAPAFSLAQKLGVKTCVGTETPLIIPGALKSELKITTPTDNDIKSLYKGMFTRITKSFPVDYYWLWTPENWTWKGASDNEVAQTEHDLALAEQVLSEMGKPFQLATCGWVLGPPKDRAQFDKHLPKNIPFSCINRGVGYVPVETGFAKIKDRPKWSIPWMEDDPTLISTQQWVGRILKDAYDSKRYGCNGLFGIHWRTRILAPTVSSLAFAAWNVPQPASLADTSSRDLPSEQFYADFITSQFGFNDSTLTGIFVSMDSKGTLDKNGNKGDAPLNSSDWIQGPGGILNQEPEQIKEKLNRYGFIPTLETYRARMVSPGNLERFEYWLNSYKFNKASLEVALYQKELMKQVEAMKLEKDAATRKKMAENAINNRVLLAKKWEEMMAYQLAKTTTMGDLGTIANLEMHNIGKLNYLYGYDNYLKEQGVNLPESCFPTTIYKGKPRLIVPSCPSILEKNEALYQRVRILSQNEVNSVTLYIKNLGGNSYKSLPFKKMERNVFEINIPAADIPYDFEYYIEAVTGGGKIVYPATAGDINLTVVRL